MSDTSERVPMTAEQVGPFSMEPDTIGVALRRQTLLINKEPDCSLPIERAEDAVEYGNRGYKIGYAQGRKSMEAELERVRKERDYTPEEVYAEIKKRGWHPYSITIWKHENGKFVFEVRGQNGDRLFNAQGDSFRAAFAKADKKALEGGEA